SPVPTAVGGGTGAPVPAAGARIDGGTAPATRLIGWERLSNREGACATFSSGAAFWRGDCHAERTRYRHLPRPAARGMHDPVCDPRAGEDRIGCARAHARLRCGHGDPHSAERA